MATYPTGEQMRAIVAEINDFNAHKQKPESWQVTAIEYLPDLQPESYNVRYSGGFSHVVSRKRGKLVSADTWTYSARSNFEDTHPLPNPPESEVQP